ncbi:hypothetical protein AtDm6_2860 [Acetobacter tropicalis]|uniref:Uncharacterized protein n=1 Tax=Acetobacter tropicalis TaxID=104102 RepID=A0A094YKT8_9PROT|nr:hypothetical protein AtDm6_2860 [Acetobacter tropicalis]
MRSVMRGFPVPVLTVLKKGRTKKGDTYTACGHAATALYIQPFSHRHRPGAG